MRGALQKEIEDLGAERVMRAVATLIERGVDELTFARVAEASGVGERTLYRWYSTRAALLEAFWRWLNLKIEAPPPPQTPSDLVGQIPQLYSAFDAAEPLVRAMLHDRNGREARLGQADARRKRLHTALRNVLAPLGAKERDRLLASVQLLASAAAWESMRDNWGLSSTQAAESAQWAITALIAAAAGKGKERAS